MEEGVNDAKNDGEEDTELMFQMDDINGSTEKETSTGPKAATQSKNPPDLQRPHSLGRNGFSSMQANSHPSLGSHTPSLFGSENSPRQVTIGFGQGCKVLKNPNT